MIDLLKDRYKIGLMMAGLFFIGVMVSIYAVYSIPHKLMLAEGSQSALANVYVILGLTFLLGGLTIWYALQHKNEVVVFRDKQLEKSLSDNDTNQTDQTTISLESVKLSINQTTSEKEILQSGLHAICKQLEAGQGAIYVSTEKENVRKIELKVGYALSMSESSVISYAYGEGLIGQAAAGGRTLYVDEVPEGYIKIISGLGTASPRYLLIVPIKRNESVFGVIEIASFTAISEDQRKFVEESAQLIAGSIAGS